MAPHPSSRSGGDRPLAYPAFRRILAARFISTIGSWMQTVAAGYLVFQLTGDAMAVGLLAAVALAPSLVGAPIGGALADRFCPRKLSIAFAWMEAIPPAILAVAAFTGNLTVPLIFACVLLLSIPNSMGSPVLQLVIPFTVPERLRHRAVADNSAAYNVGQLVGALLGGTVVQVLGAGVGFAANAISYVLVAVVLMLSPVLQEACDMARATHKARIRDGLREGWGLRVVQTTLFGAAVFFVLVAPIEQLMPTIAAAHGESAMLLGGLVGALCLGAMIANPLMHGRVGDGPSAERAVIAGVLLCAPATVLLGLSSSLWTDVPLLLVIGFAWEMIFVSGGSALQLDVPMHIRGRMVGLFYLLVTGSAALGALLMGALFQDAGVTAGLVLVGALALAGGLGLALRHRRAAGAVLQAT